MPPPPLRRCRSGSPVSGCSAPGLQGVLAKGPPASVIQVTNHDDHSAVAGAIPGKGLPISPEQPRKLVEQEALRRLSATRQPPWNAPDPLVRMNPKGVLIVHDLRNQDVQRSLARSIFDEDLEVHSDHLASRYSLNQRPPNGNPSSTMLFTLGIVARPTNLRKDHLHPFSRIQTSSGESASTKYGWCVVTKTCEPLLPVACSRNSLARVSRSL